jgi:Lon protease-like protein
MDLSFEAATFSGWAPLFPLSGVVLLPGALLPLHIFEPRYRLMLKDALDGEKLIAMALLDESSLEDASIPEDAAVPAEAVIPVIDEWVGLGRVVAHEPLPDGRSNLLLAGLRRARVLEEDRSRPYRRGRLAVVEDDPTTLEDAARARELRARVVALLSRLPAALVRDPVRLGVAIRMEQLALGALVDLAADAVRLETEEKVILLHEPRVRERAEKLLAVLGVRAGTGRYPARFSRN